AHPNLCAGPIFRQRAVDLWGSAGALNLSGAQIAIRDGLPVLRLRGEARPLAVFACTAANLGGEPYTQLLLRTSFRDAPAAQFRAADLVFSAEIAEPRWAPRVRGPNGDIVRSRRTALGGEALARLTACRSPAVRYAEWQQLAADHGWPSLLTVRRGDEPALL